MTGSYVWDIVLSVAAATVVLWLILVAALLVLRPQGVSWRDAVRLLPDVIRLVRRLAPDRSLPRGVRVRLSLLLAYLAFPIDLIPDFIPVLGYADDAIVIVAVLRAVVRRAGLATVRDHWPGTDAGFETVRVVCGLGR